MTVAAKENRDPRRRFAVADRLAILDTQVAPRGTRCESGASSPRFASLFLSLKNSYDGTGRAGLKDGGAPPFSLAGQRSACLQPRWPPKKIVTPTAASRSLRDP